MLKSILIYVWFLFLILKHFSFQSSTILYTDLPDPGIEPRYPASQADSSPTELSGKPSFPTLKFKFKNIKD